jgi:hypothetical protein
VRTSENRITKNKENTMTTARVMEQVGLLSGERKALLLARLRRWLAEVDTIKPVGLNEKVEGVALTASQRRLFDMGATEDGSIANNVVQRVTFSGRLDADTFVKSLNMVAARHPAFHTRIAQRRGMPVQFLDRQGAPALEVLDLRAAPHPEQTLQSLSAEMARTRFSLDGEMLFKFALVSLSDQRHVLLLVTHNLVFDAWSYSIFIEELKQCYNLARSKEGTLPLAPAVDAFDHAVWRSRHLATRQHHDGVQMWLDRLGRPHGDELRTDEARGPQREYRGGRIEFALPLAARDRLTKIGKSRQATRFMTLLASIQSFLAHRMGMQHFCVGTINAGRGRQQIEPVIGYFLNLTPIPASIDPQRDSFVTVIDQAKKEATASLEGGDVYFEEIVAASGLPFSANRNPYFDVLFAFENVPEESTQFNALEHRFEDLDKGTARYDLTFSLYDEADRFHGWLEYNAALFKRKTAEDIAHAFAAWLERVCEQPEQALIALGAAR